MRVIDCGMAELSGPKRFLPKVGICLTEGALGAGPDSTLDFSNSFDVGVQARWNLTDLLKAGDLKRIADSQRQQVEYSYEDLRGKLALGVREAQDESLTGREQIDHTRRADSSRQRSLPAKQAARGAKRPRQFAGGGLAGAKQSGTGAWKLYQRRECV